MRHKDLWHFEDVVIASEAKQSLNLWIASSLPVEGTFKGIRFSPDACGVRASVATLPRNDGKSHT